MSRRSSPHQRTRATRVLIMLAALVTVVIVASIQPWQQRATAITPASVHRHALASGGTGPISNLADTWVGVHFGNPFDAYITGSPKVIAPSNYNMDYIWGASATNSSVLPYSPASAWAETYFPWRREVNNQGKSWVLANHPDWVMYKCDKSTIAAWDNSASDLVEVDTSNTAYQSYLEHSFIDHGLKSVANGGGGWSGLSVDNGVTANVGQACGHWTGQQGTSTWVPMFNGTVLNDPTYINSQNAAYQAVANYVRTTYPNATITLNAGYNTFINYSYLAPGYATSDMISDEYGWTNGGGGYTTSDGGGEVSNRWLGEMQRYEVLQRDQNKGIWFNNNRAAGGLTNYQSDTNSQAKFDVNWNLANYLLIKYHHTYMDLVGSQHYGYALNQEHEYETANASIGSPTDDFYASGSVYQRDYTGGTVFVNPSSSTSYTINVPAGQFKDLYGNAVTTQSMPAHSGLILLSTTPQATPTPGAASTATNTPIPGATATNTPVLPTATATTTPAPVPTPTGALQVIEGEAPGNALAGSAVIGSCARCSGGQDVQYLGRNNGTLTINGLTPPSAGTYSLGVDCIAGDSSAGNPARTFLLQINGGAGQTLTCPATPNFAPITEYATVALNAGANTALVSNPDPNSPAPDIDRVTLYSANAAPTATATPGTVATATNTPSGVTSTPTATGVPASGPYILYDNQLENGTQDYSYGLTSHSFAATTPTYGGSSASIAAQYTAGSFGAVKLRLSPTPFNPAPYTTLHVALYPGAGATTPLLISLDNNVGTNLGSYAVTPPAGQWTTYDIPLSTLDPSGVPATDLLFADQNGAGFSYNIDDLRLVPAAGGATATATPTNAATVAPTATNTPGGATNTPATGFVTRQGTALSLNGQRFRSVGAQLGDVMSWTDPNGVYVGCGAQSSDAQVATEFGQLQAAGINTVRVSMYYAFTNGATDWRRADLVVQQAAAHNVRLIVTLFDNYNYCDQIPSSGGASKLDSWYTTDYKNAPQGRWNISARAYAQVVAARYATSPGILAWELVNEPRDQDAAGNGYFSHFQSFVNDMVGVIKAVDPNHLIAFGTGGGGTPGISDANYLTLLQQSNIDVGTYHDYAQETTAMPAGLQTLLGQCNTAQKACFVGEAGINGPNKAGAGNSSPYYSLTQRVSLFQAKWNAFFANPSAFGYTIWIFNENETVAQEGDNEFTPNDPLLTAEQTYNQQTLNAGGSPATNTPAPAPTTGFTVASATPTNTPPAGATVTNTPTSTPIGAATPTATPPSGATATPTNTPQPTATNTPSPTAGPGSPTPTPAPYSITMVRVPSTLSTGTTLVVAAFVNSTAFLPRPRLTFTIATGNTTVVTLTPYRARLYIQARRPVFVVATWHVPANATLGGYTVVGHLNTGGGASLADSAPQSFTLAASNGGGGV